MEYTKKNVKKAKELSNIEMERNNMKLKIREEIKLSKITPGPGAYNIQYKCKNQKSNMNRFSKNNTIRMNQTDLGPGSYDPSNIFYGQSKSFGISLRELEIKKETTGNPFPLKMYTSFCDKKGTK